MKNLLLIALSTVAISAHAWEPDVYVGANGASWQYKHQSVGTNFTLNTLEGVAGLKLAKYIAVEARVGVGLNDARGDTVTGITVVEGATSEDPDIYTGNVNSYEVNTAGNASVYLKPMISNEKATLYGLLGYTSVQIEHTGSTHTGAALLVEEQLTSFGATGAEAPLAPTFDDTEANLSYGVGVSFNLWEKAELTAEWRKLVNGDEFDMRGGSIGFLYKF